MFEKNIDSKKKYISSKSKNSSGKNKNLIRRKSKENSDEEEMGCDGSQSSYLQNSTNKSAIDMNKSSTHDMCKNSYKHQ